MYLPLTSQHPPHSKAGVPSGEFIRMLTNNSRADIYFEHLQMCQGFIESKGYGMVTAPSDFDAHRRQVFLSKCKDPTNVDHLFI